MRAVEYRIVELEMGLRFGFAQVEGCRPLVCSRFMLSFSGERSQPK
jgi:hypothetical protein